MADKPKKVAEKDATRPQDWAAPMRLAIFGANTLSDAELTRETQRLEVFTQAGNKPWAEWRRDAARAEMQQRRMGR